MAQDDLLFRARRLAIGAQGQGDGERRYRLVAQIDRGGMGELFLAEAIEAGQPPREVVIKRLLPDLLEDDKYVTMFASEAEVMAQLDHPNIVRLYDTPVIEGTRCLAMELVRGRNAQQILARAKELGRAIPPRIVFQVMIDVLLGLEYAHDFHLADGTALNLVHRDITPGNILVSFEGDTKLTDFGIAKSQMSAVSTTVGIVKGKARYLAPEQILGEPPTPRADIFSAACVTFEMLSGRSLFDRGSIAKTLYAIVNGEHPPLENELPVRSARLVDVLGQALHTDANLRLQHAKDLAAGLEEAAREIDGLAHRGEIGAYVRDLFQGVDDARAAVDPPPVSPARPETPAPVPVAVPVPTEPPSADETPLQATVHTYLPEPPAKRPAGPIPLIALGAVLGAILTLSIQALVSSGREPAPAPSAEAIAATTPPPAPPEPPDEPDATPMEDDAKPDAIGPVEPEMAFIDLLEPKGAKIKIDGVTAKEKVPVRSLALKPGHHELRISKGRYKRDLGFSLEPGQRLDLTRRLRRHANR